MKRYWTQQSVPWPPEIADALAYRSCEATTWTPNDAFVNDRLTRAQALTRTHFRVDHPQGMVTFAVERPILGGYNAYQQTLREKINWSSGLLDAWAQRVRECPRNDPGGARRPKDRPAYAKFPVALYASLKAALAGIPSEVGSDYEPHVRLVLERFLADHSTQFPRNTVIVLKRGPGGATAVELMDAHDERAIAAAWDDFFGRKTAGSGGESR